MYDDVHRALGRVATNVAGALALLHVRAHRTEYAVLACALREALATVTVTEHALRAVYEEGEAAGMASAAAEVAWLREQLAAAQAREARPALRTASGEVVTPPAPARSLRVVRP